MKTLYLTTSPEDLKTAAEIIKAGGLVAFPTETVYGLGGNALDPQASRKIYAAKGRPSDNPLIVHISSDSQIEAIATSYPEAAKKLASALWPGPMTMVLPKKAIVPGETTGGLATVAIRLPATESARMLIDLAGLPIAAPSANLSGRPSPTKWQHVRDDLDGKIDAIIMGEPCMGGIESTVIDMTGDSPMILRPGLITPEMVQQVLGTDCDYDPAIKGRPDEGLVPKAPGMKYKHYAPAAEVIIYRGLPQNTSEAMKADRQLFEAEGKKVFTCSYSSPEETAEKLFDDLRQGDIEKADLILVSAFRDQDVKDKSLNYSVMNRMLKAAGYKVKEV